MKQVVIIILVVLFASCHKSRHGIRIGYSYPGLETRWSNIMYDEIVKGINLYQTENVVLFARSAEYNPEKQNADIIDLVFNKKIDVLILHSTDKEKIIPVLEQVYDMGIPVVTLDQQLNTDKYRASVGFSNIEFGRKAATYAARILKNKGKVIEIKGGVGVSSSIHRSQGFYEVLDTISEIEIIASYFGKWSDDSLKGALDSLLNIGANPDLIFAHNDLMAIGARKVCDAQNVHPIIIGIDGLPKAGQGIDMVKQGIIDATFYNRPGGDVCVDLAVKLAKGEQVVKNYQIQTFPIDKFNVDGLQQGFSLVEKQQQKIQKLQQQIGMLMQRFRFQRLITFSFLAVLALLVVFGILILYFLKQKQKFIQVIHEKSQDLAQKVEEEMALNETLTQSNALLNEQREEIIDKNNTLVHYQVDLEQEVEQRTMELQHALQKAQESDELKFSFISNLSHELRTPINAIIGFGELLFQNEFSYNERKHYKSIILKSSDELFRLVENILELSVANSSGLAISKSNIQLPEFMFDYYQKFLSKYSSGAYGPERAIRIKLDAIDNCVCYTDASRLEQVLDQILGNAIKYTQEGDVVLGVHQNANDNCMLFFVRDSGIGIHPKYHQSIFESFRKIEDNKQELYRGNGLGLTISKFVVEQLGGKIWVESAIGKGSTFRFTIPC